MPSVSQSQHRFMEWAKSNPKEAGISKEKVTEWMSHDQGWRKLANKVGGKKDGKT